MPPQGHASPLLARLRSGPLARASRSGSRSRVNASVEISLDTDAWKRQRVLFGVRV